LDTSFRRLRASTAGRSRGNFSFRELDDLSSALAASERVIAAHPSVAMVAVGGQPDALKGEIAKAYVVLKPDAQPDAEAILPPLPEQLAAYKAPRLIQFVADLRKASTGKIMRRELCKLDS
jgi:long-chain acyl-CoA synthetase